MLSRRRAAAARAPPSFSGMFPALLGDEVVLQWEWTDQTDYLGPKLNNYTNAGNFKAGTFLLITQPSFIQDLYPGLLSTDDQESSRLPLILSMFNTEARIAQLEEDWRGKRFSIAARLFPNELTNGCQGPGDG